MKYFSKLRGRYLTFIRKRTIIILKGVNKMARTARVKDEYGIYYINQVSSEDINLFNDNVDRDKFLSILSTSREKNDFKLYAYCLMNPNEYHLILNANGSDISKIMKEINISYAMYLNHSNNIYKDRYKSTLIKDKENLMLIINKIHVVGKNTASIYNSYCYYNEEILITTDLIDKLDLQLIVKDNCLSRNSECKDCIKTVEDGIAKLNDLAQSKTLTIEELLKNKPLRNDMIRLLRRTSTLSLKELGNIFGGLSESAICKILNGN